MFLLFFKYKVHLFQFREHGKGIFHGARKCYIKLQVLISSALTSESTHLINFVVTFFQVSSQWNAALELHVSDKRDRTEDTLQISTLCNKTAENKPPGKCMGGFEA
jgi:hypothetical protein